MRKRKLHLKGITTIALCGALLLPFAKTELNVYAEEAVNAIAENGSDLLTSSLIFQKGNLSYSQPFCNFLVSQKVPANGIEGYTILINDNSRLEAYMDLVNQILASEIHQENAYYPEGEANGLYVKGIYTEQISDETKKCIYDQIAYHAIGAMSGDVIIDLEKLPLAKQYLQKEEKQCTLSLDGEYETSYRTSSASRCNNVERAAANFNNTIVAPGEVISCSNLFLPRTAENGYQMAGIYLNGEVAQGMGGGVCQVSSTVYASSLKAGLDIVERHPHSLPVAYIPTGMDATISYPALDLKIRNNKQNPIIFKTQTQNKRVKIQIYSMQ